MTHDRSLIARARVAAGTSWDGEDGGHGNKTESQDPEVRRILRECADALEKLFWIEGFSAQKIQFIDRIDRQLHGHFGWEEHESAAWTTSAGGMREGEPDFSHKCEVIAHLTRPGSASFPAAMWWQWTARVSSGGASYRARGYAKSMDEGKTACETAVHVLAYGILTQFMEKRS
jgi:hypothetical protein